MSEIIYRIRFMDGEGEDLPTDHKSLEDATNDLELKLGKHVKWMRFGEKYINVDNVNSIEIIEVKHKLESLKISGLV